MGILNSNWIYKLIPFNLNIIYEKTSFHNWVIIKNDDNRGYRRESSTMMQC